MKYVSLIILVLITINCNTRNNNEEISSLRKYGIENDTTSRFTVFKKLTLGADTATMKLSFDTIGWVFESTALYLRREAMCDYEQWGLKGAYAKSLGSDPRSAVDKPYSDSELKRFYESFKDKPKYGKMYIDKYYARHKLRYCEITVPFFNENKKSVIESFTGWITYLDDSGIVNSVICIFDVRISSSADLQSKLDGFVALLSERYGDKYIKSSDGISWFCGKYEIILDVSTETDEFIIKYRDNKLLKSIEDKKHELYKHNEDSVLQEKQLIFEENERKKKEQVI